MTIYLQLLILAAVVIYIVDVSGFTDSWRSLVERWMNNVQREQERRRGQLVHVHADLRPLPPFDCGKCATFWACCIFAAFKGEFSLLTLAEAAGLSLLSLPISHLLRFLIEAPTALIDKLTPYE